MRKMILLLVLVSLAALGAAGAALAASGGKFEAGLTGGGEVPAVETAATGEADFELKDGVLEYELEAADIENVTVGHIHLGPADGVGPPVVDLISQEACEFEEDEVECEGSITGADLAGPLAGRSLDDLLAEMRRGNTYTNVHTVRNPGGEIRGQNLPD